MAIQQTASNALAADARSLNALKLQAGQDSPAAIKEAAKQFESLFMRELIKSMRDATQKSGLLEGQGSDLGTDLLDQQFAVQLSGLPGGLSEAIERQLGRQMSAAKTPEPIADTSTVGRASAGPRQAGFVDQHSEAAATVARESGR